MAVSLTTQCTQRKTYQVKRRHMIGQTLRCLRKIIRKILRCVRCVRCVVKETALNCDDERRSTYVIRVGTGQSVQQYVRLVARTMSLTI